MWNSFFCFSPIFTEQETCMVLSPSAKKRVSWVVWKFTTQGKAKT